MTFLLIGLALWLVAWRMWFPAVSAGFLLFGGVLIAVASLVPVRW
jgi:hypothetical protein